VTPLVSYAKRSVVAVLLLLALVLQGTTSVLAGTTGAINGTVVDPQSNQPVSGAQVTAVSPSQSATTTSDPTGRFSFISLAPDTYVVSVAPSSTRDAASVSGVTVQADQTLTVSLQQSSKLKVIGTVTSRSASALVKPGTTADVYSINALSQDKASTVGGGGNLNTAWSAITTVPGVYVAPNQAGYIGAAATLSIRGGDYDQIGYELDGVPVNRAFDNYPSGPLSSLGQQELQVYTGATPANSEAEGISGYINQVIRTGTAPASRNLTLATGAPTFYGKLSFEAGGANPTRTFSYYLGTGAYNQNYRYYDQYNGAGLQQTWGSPLAPCNPARIPRSVAPSCYSPSGADYTNGGVTEAWALGPYNAFSGFNPQIQDRDAVLNLHFGIPRKDGNRDDVQFLFDNNFINNFGPTSINDQGGQAFLTAIGAPAQIYNDGNIFTAAAPGQLLPPGFTGGPSTVSPYLFPDSPGGRAFLSSIAPDRRDAFVNNQSILKLQYQHNFGTSAFLRVYGYTYYSDWLQNGPNSSNQINLGFVPSQYLLDSHTRGVSAQFSDQLNSQHLLSIQGSYTTATTLRDNNTSFIGGSPNQEPPTNFDKYSVAGVLVDSSNPGNGVCYAYAMGVPTAVPCYNGSGSGLNQGAGYFSIQQSLAGGLTPATGTCGGGPCRYLVVGNGYNATYNTVVPKFTSFSITDQWKPTDRLNINLGLRFDGFTFDGSDTTNGGLARTFWYNAWNAQFPSLKQVNVSGQVESYSELEPRLGMTYTVNPSTVLRASYGRYAQAPNSAFEQYNFLQPVAPIGLENFVKFGIGNTPAHAIRPSVSNNYDLSLEHQFSGDTSMKLSPFLRKTQDQIQQFFLDQRTSFVSGLNVGRQTSEGFELEVDKGDFSRNGLATRLSFTYTNSYINYGRTNTGLSVIDPFNAAINAYDGFTKGGGGSPCYTQATAAAPGAPIACGTAGAVANPYYNAPTQPLMDPNGNYATYDIFPGGIGTGGYFSYGAPYVATWIVQYKHGPLAITPALQFIAGTRYGVPESTPGIDPTSCTGVLPSATAGDPRYPYGGAGGSPYNATTCGSILPIPDPYTGKFDNIGAFVNPSQLLLHTQISWDINKRVTLVGNFANIINRCFGGTKVGFAVSHACGYGALPIESGGNVPIGNQYNPGFALQPASALPYYPTFPTYPFNMYFEARIKV
jgi:hypothetical protein